MDLQHSAIWMSGVYLMLLMQFLENKVAMELTRSEFVEAQAVGILILEFSSLNAIFNLQDSYLD